MRYLVVKTSAFGDVVQSFCVLNYLKTIHPNCTIDWVVEKKISSLVHAHPLVDTVIESDTKTWKRSIISSLKKIYRFIKTLRKHHYDAVFDLQGNTKSGIIALFSRSQHRIGFGWQTANERLNCCFTTHRVNPPQGQNIRRDYLYIVQDFFHDFTGDPCQKINFLVSEKEGKILEEYNQYITPSTWMICPGSAWENKQLPEETLTAFLRRAVEVYHPHFMFIWGSQEEKESVERMTRDFPHATVCPLLSPPAIQKLMQKMQLVVSVDSFPLALAGTTTTPTVSFFGPSLSWKYRPIGDVHFSFQGNCGYGQVFNKRCAFLRSCKNPTCMRSQEELQLFQSFSLWWDQRHTSHTAQKW